MEYIEKHVADMEFNAIFSQLALAALLKYPQVESAVVGRKLMELKLKKKEEGYDNPNFGISVAKDGKTTNLQFFVR
jgi:hypothetical protein